MTVPSAVGSFAIVAGLLTITPGLDTALVLRAAVTQSRRHAFATALGINSGALIWGVTAAVGVSALLAASHLAYTALRLAGAAYLIWLGTNMLWRSLRRRKARAATDPAVAADPATDPAVATDPAAAAGPTDRCTPAPAAEVIRSWSRGLATNLLNPKVGVFYLAMLPQFIPEHASHLFMGLLLALVHDLEGMAWFSLLICGTHVVRGRLRGGTAHRAVDRITGTVLVGFGLKLALSDK